MRYLTTKHLSNQFVEQHEVSNYLQYYFGSSETVCTMNYKMVSLKIDRN